MRINLIIIYLLFFALSAIGQNDIELIEEHEGNQVLVYVKNNRNDAVEITISADIKGFTTNALFPYKQKIDANNKVWAFTLTETIGIENSYRFNVSYSVPKQVVAEQAPTDKSRLTDISLDVSKVNIFTKDGCGRCAAALKYLTENNIPFNDLNTTIHRPNNALMFEKLGEAGFTSGSVTMPVIVYKDSVYYNIKDLTAILKSFKIK